jgi:dipeptide transport system substrate-binding protein
VITTPCARTAGTLTVCTGAAPDGFDIAQHAPDAAQMAVVQPLYDPLLQFKPGGTGLKPGLAESWDTSADGLVYTLRLRRGVKFHSTPWFTPTREFNADDVLFSLNRINDRTHSMHRVARNGYAYWQGRGLPALIKGIAKLDDFTVRITLNRPEAPFLSDLAMAPGGSVFSAEYGAQLFRAGTIEQLGTQPVGTGPFVFERYQKDVVVRYTANAAHWGGAPPVDRLAFVITPDPSLRAQRLQSGDCVAGIDLNALRPPGQRGAGPSAAAKAAPPRQPGRAARP